MLKERYIAYLERVLVMIDEFEASGVPSMDIVALREIANIANIYISEMPADEEA